MKLAPLAARTWRRMQAAASIDGVELLPLSGFRNVARQTTIIRPKLAAGERIGEILRFVAAPAAVSTTRAGRSTSVRPAFRRSMSDLPGPPGFAGYDSTPAASASVYPSRVGIPTASVTSPSIGSGVIDFALLNLLINNNLGVRLE